MPAITFESLEIEGIPCILCLPAQTVPAPIVFYVPGYGGHKEDGLALAWILAQRGIACLVFDPLYHGARYDARLQRVPNGIFPVESGLDMFFQFLQIIRQCSLDIGTLLPHLAQDTRLDMNRAGVTGVSQGAYATFLAFADHPSLRCAVPMMGVPTFTRRWTDLLNECAWSNTEWDAGLKPLEGQIRNYTQTIQQFDPCERLLEAAPRPLLLMNGDFDYDQPKFYTLGWYGPMRAHYAANPEHLKWNIYPVGHTVTPQMEEDAADWFARHLSDG